MSDRPVIVQHRMLRNAIVLSAVEIRLCVRLYMIRPSRGHFSVKEFPAKNVSDRHLCHSTDGCVHAQLNAQP